MITAIVQARRGSTRFPGKVLSDVEGVPLLRRVLDRVRAARTIQRTVVATSRQPENNVLESRCERWDIPCYRGPENDVLSRYRGAAIEREAPTVVRITGDCPLVDPTVIDRVVRRFASGSFDYVSNVEPRTYPDGLDVEVFSRTLLKTLDERVESPEEREHVTLHVRRNLDRFRVANIEADNDRSDHRWTVDWPEDLDFVRRVYSHLDDPLAGMKQILDLLSNQPQMARINGKRSRAPS